MLCDLNMTYAPPPPPPHPPHSSRPPRPSVHHLYASAMSIAASPLRRIHRVPSQSAKQLAYRGRLHNIHTCPPRPSSARHGSAVRCVACTGYHTNLQGERKYRRRIRYQAEGKVNCRTSKLCSPVLSTSHVSMRAPGTGSPLVVSNAIDSPIETVWQM